MKSMVVFFGVFAAVGSICLLICLYTLNSSIQKNNSWVEAKGAITGFAGSGYPTITFDYYGQPMEFHSSYTSSDMREGDEVVVYFPPDHPEEAEIKGFFNQWFIPLFLSLFALVFGGIGFYGLSKQIKRMNAKRDLFTHGKGRKTPLPISEIVVDSSFKVNGRNPYVIVCQLHDPVSNKMYEFRSDYTWYNPTELLSERKDIDTYVDPNNLANYYMDISFLPKKA